MGLVSLLLQQLFHTDHHAVSFDHQLSGQVDFHHQTYKTQLSDQEDFHHNHKNELSDQEVSIDQTTNLRTRWNLQPRRRSQRTINQPPRILRTTNHPSPKTMRLPTSSILPTTSSILSTNPTNQTTRMFPKTTTNPILLN